MNNLVNALTVLESAIAEFVTVDQIARDHEASIGTAALEAMTDAELDAIDTAIGHSVKREAVKVAEMAVVRAYLPLSDGRRKRGEDRVVLAQASRDWKFRAHLVRRAQELAA